MAEKTVLSAIFYKGFILRRTFFTVLSVFPVFSASTAPPPRSWQANWGIKNFMQTPQGNSPPFVTRFFSSEKKRVTKGGGGGSSFFKEQ
ncbi:MAG: hypothetical protein E7044_03745 [Lentisphaerae bacterium]|nr:hypothetical protein [Lentisphaerota bacterium]